MVGPVVRDGTIDAMLGLALGVAAPFAVVGGIDLIVGSKDGVAVGNPLSEGCIEAGFVVGTADDAAVVGANEEIDAVADGPDELIGTMLDVGV